MKIQFIETGVNIFKYYDIGIYNEIMYVTRFGYGDLLNDIGQRNLSTMLKNIDKIGSIYEFRSTW